MKKAAVILMAILSGVQLSANADGLDAERIYVGGGLNFNSLPGVGSSRGFQFFGGYEFEFILNQDITSALEIGYMDSGNFDRLSGATSSSEAKGIWISMLESVPLSSKTDMLVRLGYDFGDDDGLLLGTGLQYKFDTKIAMRMEYVAREHVHGLQANVLFKF